VLDMSNPANANIPESLLSLARDRSIPREALKVGVKMQDSLHDHEQLSQYAGQIAWILLKAKHQQQIETQEQPADVIDTTADIMLNSGVPCEVVDDLLQTDPAKRVIDQPL
jgi:hypothetical protein